MLGTGDKENCWQLKLSLEKQDDALDIEDDLGECCSIAVYSSDFCDDSKDFFINNLNMLYLDDDCIKFHKTYNGSNGYCLLFSQKFLNYNLLQKLIPLVEFGYYDIDFDQELQLREYFNRICFEVFSDYQYRKELAENLLFNLSHYIIRNIVLPKYYNNISN